MACFDDDVVADLECRYSDGETPTWEEFYKWIEDIQDGFSEHDHSGSAAGYGKQLDIGIVSGLQATLDALDARITTIETTYATKAYADQAEVDAKAYADTLVVDMATMTWAGSEFYTQSELNVVIANLSGGIEDNYALIGGHETRIAAIEFDYATKTWVGANHYTKSEMNTAIATLDGKIEDNYDELVLHDGRLDAIEISYATQNWVGANFRLISLCNSLMSAMEDDVEANAYDILDLDGRVDDIETDYATEGWVASYVDGSIDDAISSHEGDCSCYNTC